MPGNGQIRGTRWVFTLNNYTPDDEKRIIEASNGPEITYLVFGREVAQSGTRHLQGYLELSSRRRLNGVKELLGTDRVHLAVARGTSKEASDYCKKSDPNPFENGEISVSQQGRRNDLHQVADLVISGSSIENIAREYPAQFIRNFRGIERLASVLATKRNWRTQCIYVWGPTGSGKTTWAQKDAEALCQGNVAWIGDSSLKWFDGYYQNAKGVVIDEFVGTADISVLLRCLDQVPFRVSIKGSYLEWNPRIVWITSNYSPEHWYGNAGEHFYALMRRIDEVIHMTGFNEYTVQSGKDFIPANRQ